MEANRNRSDFKVVVNDEGQYSIWPAHRSNPLGWHETQKRGGREECLAWVDRVWADLRPSSLRRSMGESV